MRQLFADSQVHDMKALKAWLSPAFLSVHKDGVRDRAAEIKLLDGLKLGAVQLSNFTTTKAGPVMMVAYQVAAQETIAGQRIPSKPYWRLSTFINHGQRWQWLGHASLVNLK